MYASSKPIIYWRHPFILIELKIPTNEDHKANQGKGTKAHARCEYLLDAMLSDLDLDYRTMDEHACSRQLQIERLCE